MAAKEHMQHIFDALEVGLDGEDVPPAKYDLPKFSEHFDLEPGRAHGIVTLEEEDYIVIVKKAEAGDPAGSGVIYPLVGDLCPTSLDGKHLFSDHRCLGCGKVEEEDDD